MVFKNSKKIKNVEDITGAEELEIESLTYINDLELYLNDNCDNYQEFLYLDKCNHSSNTFSYLNLESIIIKNCTFNYCDFENTSFINCTFIGCDFTGSSFNKGYFDKINIIESKFGGCSFTSANLSNMIINESNFNFATHFECKLHDLKILKSIYVESFFDKCEVKNFNIKNVDFTKTEFFNTSLKGIDFRTSVIDNIRFSSNLMEIKGMIVDTYQAASLATTLGIIISD